MSRRAWTTLSTTLLFVALTASTAYAQSADGHDAGEGWWGETNDKVVTNAGFILIAFFPLFIFAMSVLQHKLDQRKDRRKYAAKARAARADLRGGW